MATSIVPEQSSSKPIGYIREDFYKHCLFTQVTTQEEYDEVLHLRHEAYSLAKKIPSHKTLADMADEFDARSIILIAKYEDAIVGSVRVIKHNETDLLSYGRYFESPPSELPPRKDYVEASRMCVHPNFNGLGIFYHLAIRMVLATIDSDKRYIVGGSTKELLLKWENCGFRTIGVKYSSKDINAIEHELIVLDTNEVVQGQGISPKVREHLARLLNRH